MKMSVHLFIPCHPQFFLAPEYAGCHCLLRLGILQSKSWILLGPPNITQGLLAQMWWRKRPRLPRIRWCRADTRSAAWDMDACRSSTKQTRLTVNEGETSWFIWLIFMKVRGVDEAGGANRFVESGSNSQCDLSEQACIEKTVFFPTTLLEIWESDIKRKRAAAHHKGIKEKNRELSRGQQPWRYQQSQI